MRRLGLGVWVWTALNTDAISKAVESFLCRPLGKDKHLRAGGAGGKRTLSSKRVRFRNPNLHGPSNGNPKSQTVRLWWLLDWMQLRLGGLSPGPSTKLNHRSYGALVIPTDLECIWEMDSWEAGFG